MKRPGDGPQAVIWWIKLQEDEAQCRIMLHAIKNDEIKWFCDRIYVENIERYPFENASYDEECGGFVVCRWL